RLVSRFRSSKAARSCNIRSGRNFSATSRSSSSSRASQTIPIPPRPRTLTSVKRPKSLCPLANSRDVAAATPPALSLITLTEYTSLRWEESLKLEGKPLQRLLGFARLAGFRSNEILCVHHDFLVERFCVNASQEEGAWLETADGKCHPIHGSCSLGRTAANRIVLESS